MTEESHLYDIAAKCPGGVETVRVVLGAYDEDPAKAHNVYCSRRTLIRDLTEALESELQYPSEIWTDDFAKFRRLVMTQRKLRLDEWGTCDDRLDVLVTATQAFSGYATRSRK